MNSDQILGGQTSVFTVNTGNMLNDELCPSLVQQIL